MVISGNSPIAHDNTLDGLHFIVDSPTVLCHRAQKAKTRGVCNASLTRPKAKTETLSQLTSELCVVALHDHRIPHQLSAPRLPQLDPHLQNMKMGPLGDCLMRTCLPTELQLRNDLTRD